MPPLTIIRELRLHFHTWEKYMVRFGISCARQRLPLCQPIFSAVCIEAEMSELSSIGTDSIQTAVRIPDDALTYRFSHSYPHPRIRGERNPEFLNASQLGRSIPLLPKSVQTLIFPLTHIYKTETVKFHELLEMLDGFFAALPGERHYAMEIHNGGYLLPQYFECLARHNVTHVLSDSTDMPSLLEQIQWPAMLTSDRVVVCSMANLDPVWQLGILETVRRCISERKELCIYLSDGDCCSVERALHPLMELLTPDLAKLSPLRKKAA